MINDLNSPIVFCHNDTCYGNILKTVRGEIVLIDYEESDYNYR